MHLTLVIGLFYAFTSWYREKKGSIKLSDKENQKVYEKKCGIAKIDTDS